MKRCMNCGRSMCQVWSFGPEKNEKFFRCGYCHSETRHKAITANDLKFPEGEENHVRHNDRCLLAKNECKTTRGAR